MFVVRPRQAAVLTARIARSPDVEQGAASSQTREGKGGVWARASGTRPPPTALRRSPGAARAAPQQLSWRDSGVQVAAAVGDPGGRRHTDIRPSNPGRPGGPRRLGPKRGSLRSIRAGRARRSPF